MAGWTNKGKTRVGNGFFRAQNLPTNLYVVLVTSAVAPGADTNTLSDLTEIAAGNGYTAGGFELNRDTTDFDTLTEDDTADKMILKIKDVAWTASSGPIPASGDGARYAVLTDDNATAADREVILFWDLSEDRSVSDGQTLTLQDLEIDLTE